MDSAEYQSKAIELQELALHTQARRMGRGSMGLLTDGFKHSGSRINGADHHHSKKGAFAGVFVPTCENMWGVLIFLRFHVIVGNAGVGQALLAVFLSFLCAFCTTSSMSATVSSGGFVSKGGPYYMISRALGPCVGGSVGIMYWLALTLLAVLETLGAVEGLMMAAPGANFSSFATRFYGSLLFVLLGAFVFGGIAIVTKLGLVFVLVVFFSLFIYYYGLATAPATVAAGANSLVTGLSLETLRANWGSHYGEGKDFGYVLSVFFPCFTGILSGANRADILEDPPRDLRWGTFGAIIFSLLMYTSFMVLWGMVAEYPYLRGNREQGLVNAFSGRRLSGGGAEGGYIVEEIVWNPFPHAAHLGIIVSCCAQALQCLVVAPRLLQSVAKDRILEFLRPVAPLTGGEPKRALGVTYVVGALCVLTGQLDLVAPLLSMCFLVCYAFMNFSCFALTCLKSATWRPAGIHQKRWRMWYKVTGGGGFLIAVTIMFTISILWALAAISLSMSLYFYINFKLEQREWGSAVDGIRYQLALSSLIQLEKTQLDLVNWRPQILILYRIRLGDELNRVQKHGILRFYSQLSKGHGFCVVACVLEADMQNSDAVRKAKSEKDMIRKIMTDVNIQGFAEVVVSPSWREGTGYIIQLTGVGGIIPNTVLLDWPTNWRAPRPDTTPSRRSPGLRGAGAAAEAEPAPPSVQRAVDFVNILQTALAGDKAVLAIRGLDDLPMEPVHGTIDVWWMIHDGGFLILLAWLLAQHRTWRQCHLRIFAVFEGISEEEADNAGKHLSKVLRQRRLFYVDVEVILVDDSFVQPYIKGGGSKDSVRHEFLAKCSPHDLDGGGDAPGARGSVSVSFVGGRGDAEGRRGSHCGGQGGNSCGGTPIAAPQLRLTLPIPQLSATPPDLADDDGLSPCSKASQGRAKSILQSMVDQSEDADEMGEMLNEEILRRSKRADLVIMNLPQIEGTSQQEVETFMSYCEALTYGLDRVLFVHSSGQEIFDIGV